jgi:hypothetical protein
MRTIPATVPATPAGHAHSLEHDKLAALLASVASSAAFLGKIALALPAFGLAAVVFALHLILPSEEHW